MDNKTKEVIINVPTAEAMATGIPPNIRVGEPKYFKSFIIYDDAFVSLKELLEEDLSNEQELLKFNIRIRINIALKPTFSNDFGYVKHDSQKKLYSLLYKIADAWFVYENIYKFDGANVNSFYETETLLKDSEANELVYSFNEQLKDINISKIRENDFIKYLEHLIAVCNNSQLVNKLASFKEKFEHKTTIKHNEIIALIYAVRVAFVHNSDTALTGVSNYITKIELLQLLYSYLIEFMLLSVINVIHKKIDRVE